MTLLSDPNSCANISDWATEHIELEWEVDFNSKTIRGSAALKLKSVNRRDENSHKINLDCTNLDITSVFLICDTIGKKAIFFQVVPFKFGQCLSLELKNADYDEHITVLIEYSTGAGDKCSAVQWLNPGQTSGKQHPYLFTQCQVTPNINPKHILSKTNLSIGHSREKPLALPRYAER